MEPWASAHGTDHLDVGEAPKGGDRVSLQCRPFRGYDVSLLRSYRHDYPAEGGSPSIVLKRRNARRYRIPAAAGARPSASAASLLPSCST